MPGRVLHWTFNYCCGAATVSNIKMEQERLTSPLKHLPLDLEPYLADGLTFIQSMFVILMRFFGLLRRNLWSISTWTPLSLNYIDHSATGKIMSQWVFGSWIGTAGLK